MKIRHSGNLLNYRPILFAHDTEESAMMSPVYDDDEWRALQSEGYTNNIKCVIAWYHYKEGRDLYNTRR